LAPQHEPPAGDHAVYGMAVASELTGVKPPMLRAYEARGLVKPHRTAGGTRRYSADDIAAIRRIAELLEAGLNLAGVEAMFALEKDNQGLRAEVDRLRDRLAGQDEQAEPRGIL
jgi:MerR family transcriptional regulator/heat shock protein HspR